MHHTVTIGHIKMGKGHPLVLIAGPCVIENEDTPLEIAGFLKDVSADLNLPVIFKASYDKANRTAIDSFRGPGIEAGLSLLDRIRSEFQLPVLSDVHTVQQAQRAGEVLDVLQIPAFLCRQTDLLLAAARSGKPLNIKKGQFLAPWDMANVTAKVASTGNRQMMLTERGAMFGYNNLVVDFRSIKIMRDLGYPVVFDATHSIQLPGGRGTQSGGQREFAPLLARAAMAAGVDGLFMEVHPNPDQARCDGPNSIPLGDLPRLLRRLLAIRDAAEKN
jgi:2-dehydro-3-deoxyphosphooctonate aldolase (KDO 8-P synthase)